MRYVFNPQRYKITLLDFLMNKRNDFGYKLRRRFHQRLNIRFLQIKAIAIIASYSHSEKPIVLSSKFHVNFPSVDKMHVEHSNDTFMGLGVQAFGN